MIVSVAGVRNGRGKELGRETAREGGGRREEGGGFLSFLPRAPKFPLPLLTPATQAISMKTRVRATYLPLVDVKLGYWKVQLDY